MVEVKPRDIRYHTHAKAGDNAGDDDGTSRTPLISLPCPTLPYPALPCPTLYLALCYVCLLVFYVGK